MSHPAPRAEGSRRLAWSGTAAIVVGMPFATWWVVGDLTEPAARPEPDYFLHPLDIAPAVERTVGWAAVLLVIAGVAVLARLFWTGRLDRKWLPPIVLIAIAGAVVGYAGRILTAGVIGANIGAGMVLLGGPPLVLALVAAAIAAARRARR